MQESNSSQTYGTQQSVEKPIALNIFGVLNIVFGCCVLIRLGHSFLQELEAGQMVMPFIALAIISLTLMIWLIVLGVGLLKMKKWARRGSVMYARIQIVFIAIMFAGIIISLFRDSENAPGLLLRSMTYANALSVIQIIYVICLLIFMRSEKVRRAFAPIGR
jgi:hypothetical protein